jgi:molybdate transport repressor ModE-like protein
MKTDILNGLIVLKVVADKGSFTAAAKEMGVSTSAISQTVKQLEKQLGCILLNRTTRSTSLTELGAQFLRQYQPALEQLMDALEQLEHSSGKPMGTLRLNVPIGSWPTVIAPVVAGFQKQYPDIKLELIFEESLVDIVSAGFDAGIRPSEIAAEDMTAIRISPPFRFVVAAAPGYLKQAGYPQNPNDLIGHNCLLYKFENGQVYKRWEFEENGRDMSVAVTGSLITNDAWIAIDAAVQGLGLVYVTETLIAEQVRQGTLEVILTAYASHSDGYYLYYPNVYQVSPKLRALIDYLKTHKFR